MGRGRQKAKHQKVARALKYHTASIDVSALERELAADRSRSGYDRAYHYDEDDDEDEAVAG